MARSRARSWWRRITTRRWTTGKNDPARGEGPSLGSRAARPYCMTRLTPLLCATSLDGPSTSSLAGKTAIRIGVAIAAGMLVVLTSSPVALAASARKPRAASTPDPRPDSVLYQEARQALASLKAAPARAAKKAEWEKVVMRYRRLLARYPQSGYCDNALLAVGDLYREMARRFGAAYSADAVQAYERLVADYPSSPLGEKALYSVFEIARARGDRKGIASAAREYLDAFPDSPRAGELKAAVKKSGRAQEA